MQLLMTMPGEGHPPTRLNDLKKLGLPLGAEQEVQAIIYENRMLWEPWYENAASYADLVVAMKSRGYSGMRLYGNQIYRNSELQKMSTVVKPDKPKTMIRKGN